MSKVTSPLPTTPARRRGFSHSSQAGRHHRGVTTRGSGHGLSTERSPRSTRSTPCSPSGWCPHPSLKHRARTGTGRNGRDCALVGEAHVPELCRDPTRSGDVLDRAGLPPPAPHQGSRGPGEHHPRKPSSSALPPLRGPAKIVRNVQWPFEKRAGGREIGDCMDPEQPMRAAVLVRRGKGGRRREAGMDDWAWGQLQQWLDVRVELPVGPGHYLDLPAGHRQRRDHRHRPRTPPARGARQQRAAALITRRLVVVVHWDSAEGRSALTAVGRSLRLAGRAGEAVPAHERIMKISAASAGKE